MATERDAADLLALLDQYELEHGDDETALLRDILCASRIARERRKRPVAGFAVTPSRMVTSPGGRS